MTVFFAELININKRKRDCSAEVAEDLCQQFNLDVMNDVGNLLNALDSELLVKIPVNSSCTDQSCLSTDMFDRDGVSCALDIEQAVTSFEGAR